MLNNEDSIMNVGYERSQIVNRSNLFLFDNVWGRRVTMFISWSNFRNDSRVSSVISKHWYLWDDRMWNTFRPPCTSSKCPNSRYLIFKVISGCGRRISRIAHVKPKYDVVCGGGWTSAGSTQHIVWMEFSPIFQSNLFWYTCKMLYWFPKYEYAV
jgi:hypothetical protein